MLSHISDFCTLNWLTKDMWISMLIVDLSTSES